MTRSRSQDGSDYDEPHACELSRVTDYDDAMRLEKAGPSDMLWSAHGLFVENSVWNVRWKTLVITLVLIEAIRVPYLRVFHPAYDTTFGDAFINAVFIIDVFVQFNTAVIGGDGQWVKSRREIAVRYARSWLMVDLISALPLDLMFAAAVHLRIVKILRLAQLLRVLRLSRFCKTMQEKLAMRTSAYRVIRFVVFLCISAHWSACILWAIERNSPEHVRWLDRVGLTGTKVSGSAIFVACLQWSLSTLFPIGYGDLVATLYIPTQIYAIACMAIGAGVFTFIITRFHGLIRDAEHIERTSFQLTMERLTHVAEVARLPEDLLADLHVFMQYNRRAAASEAFHERTLLDELSRSLRAEVTRHTISNFEASDAFLVDCVLAMTTLCLPPREVMYDMGRNALWLIIDGELVHDGELLRQGDHFGQLSWQASKRQTVTRTRTWCHLSVLSKASLLDVLRKYEGMLDSTGLQIADHVEPDLTAGVVTKIVPRLSLRQARALLVITESLRNRLRAQDVLIERVDEAFGAHIGARTPSRSQGDSDEDESYRIRRLSG
ncbi:unnamed protein product (mitochondrion) [Plasmodiophora brassicae]|uniref:Ion transport domain-containing protein n=1 Tax=Plasmodiophora brassicae TaxID=37360 RepID=A0A0G4IR04_PLABS|nr:hypothetical protein PBRA_005784 [Plasmodiophora brassicae]SPQ98216.1 unnamed protein product [Plasmodiophora brassicae]